ncbi:ribonuclease HII, partial [Prochlorococcus sp. AH-736-D21]|nr:ribonuclease HII [Prochlorococcus sp. AH-736-D21]
ALKKLKDKPSELIIDGPLLLRPWNGIQKNIVSGDSKFISIASASIVAKVFRDSLMERLENKYSGYFIFKNKGYGTKEHLSVIKENGLTNLHRISFLKSNIPGFTPI